MQKRKRATGKEFISNLGKYKSAIEDISPASRKVFIWSAVSLFFICGELTLNQESLLIKQMPFEGITEKMILVFLLIMVICRLIRLAFMWNKALVFLKIKEIGFTSLVRYIYAHSTLSKPLSKLANKEVTESDMQFADYETQREIYDEVRNAEPEHPNDVQTAFRDPVAFFLEYFVVPVVVVILAVITIGLLVWAILR